MGLFGCQACLNCLRCCSTNQVSLNPATLTLLLPQDLKNALSPAECCEALGLPQMKGRKWHVQVRRGDTRKARHSWATAAVHCAAGSLGKAVPCHGPGVPLP